MTPRILVIEDDLEFARALAATLEAHGTVVQESDGEGATARLARESFELLVVDLRLPGISGIEVIARAHERAPNLPAILLTAAVEPTELIDAINRAQIYRFLSKPLNLDDLEQTVRSALEAVELRRERERLHVELREQHAAMLALYEATRELAQASGRGAIVSATLSHLPRIVQFDAAAVLLAPPPRRAGTLYFNSTTDLDERTLVALKERTLARFGEHAPQVLPEEQVRVVLLGARVAGEPLQPGQLAGASIPLEAGGELWGLVQLLRRNRAYTSDEHRLLEVIASQTAQALRRDEELVVSQRRQVELLVRSMADGVVMIDDMGEVELVNPAARHLLGLEGEGVISLEEISGRLGFHPFELLRGLEHLGRDFIREEVEHEGRHLHALVSPVLDPTLSPTGVAVVLRDLTAEKELERRKEEFVSVVSHELRTPLASIAGSLDLVLRGYVGDVAPKQRHYLEMARDSCTRLNVIVDDLLDLSKYESGRLEVVFEEVDLPALLREAVERFQPAALGAHVDLRALASGEHLVSGDPHRLGQVLNNLLSNALKFTPRGGTIEASLLASAALPDHVGFRVWNSGTPIEERDLERIFEKFIQLPSSKRKPGGTGLGLAIARGLVEAHGGRLWADSDANGVAFLAVLPRRAPDGSTHPTLDATAVEAVSASPGSDPVLVVDRDPVTAHLLRGLLARYGLQARETTDPQKALELLRAGSFSLVLLDPEVRSGRRRLARALQSDPRTRDLSLFFTDAPGPRAPHVPAQRRPLDGARLVAGAGRALAARVSGHRPLVLLLEPAGPPRTRTVTALTAAGCEVIAASSARQAQKTLRGTAPDLLVVDGELPDGIELARNLGVGQPTGPALFVLAGEPSMLDKVRAFGEGASDVVPRPTDPEVLAERTREILRRRASPAGERLPGPHAIERLLRQRLLAQASVASLHITLEDLRPYREIFGHARTETVVEQVGDLIRDVLRACGLARDVAGHVGFAHFVVVTEPDRADAIGLSLLTSLERVLPLFCAREDRSRGYLTLPGDGGRAPLPSGCVVAVIDPGGRFLEPTEIFAMARATRDGGRKPGQSVYLRDEATGITAKTEISS